MIWLVFAAMALVVVAALLWPLLRSPVTTADRAAYDMTVFRDQLDEVDRDVGRGVLTAAEADAARVEIQRRLLGASRDVAQPVRSESPRTRALLTAGLAVIVPFLGLGLYLKVGAPLLPDGPTSKTATAANAASVEGSEADAMALVDKLAERMRQDPDRAEGWALLARSYRQMERFADAAEAYRNLMRLQPGEADNFSGFGEVATAAANGTITDEARAAFVQALRLERNEPRAQFYLGVAAAQSGDPATALAIWRALTAAAPSDAPWVATVRDQMAAVAQDAGIMPMAVEPRHALDVADGKGATKAPAPKPVGPPTGAAAVVPPSTPNDPTSPDVSALKERFSSENLEMIQGMVGGLAGRLENNPDDYNGWLMLARSYTVLKNTSGAKDAYKRAMALKPQELAPKVQWLVLALQDTNLDKPLPADVLRQATDIQALEGRQPSALFALGLAKAQAGDTKAARSLWTTAQGALPAEAPLHQEIGRRLAALK